MVVSAGINYDRQCNTNNWNNIIKIYANSMYTVGLRNDGTVLATGSLHSYCSEKNTYWSQLNKFNEITEIAIGDYHIVGLRSDGTVVATGDDSFNQCSGVTNWTNIKSVVAGFSRTIGLYNDGKVVSTYLAQHENCVKEWTDIVEIAISEDLIAGLRIDGTVETTRDKLISAREKAIWYYLNADISKDDIIVATHDKRKLVSENGSDNNKINNNLMDQYYKNALKSYEEAESYFAKLEEYSKNYGYVIHLYVRAAGLFYHSSSYNNNKQYILKCIRKAMHLYFLGRSKFCDFDDGAIPGAAIGCIDEIIENIDEIEFNSSEEKYYNLGLLNYYLFLKNSGINTAEDELLYAIYGDKYQPKENPIDRQNRIQKSCVYFINACNCLTIASNYNYPQADRYLAIIEQYDFPNYYKPLEKFIENTQ